MIRLVIPAYNEAPNVERLFERLRPVASELSAQVIVVDDGSTDQTAELVREHAQGLDLKLVQHDGNQGLGVAVTTGLRTAIAGADPDDAIVTLEADTTSDLGDLPAMLGRFGEGYDVVLASVHAPGGQLVGVAGWRVVASRSVSNVFRYATGLREVHTLSGLYRVYRASALQRAVEIYGNTLIREPGFAVNIELLLKLRGLGARVCEVPTTNDWTARAGESKMRTGRTAGAYGRLLLGQMVERIEPKPIVPRIVETGDQ